MNHASPSSSKGSNGVNQATILKENKWINCDLRPTTASLDWQQREVMKALEGKYDRQEFRRSNMNFEPHLPSKWAYSFDTENLFTFYGIMVEKIEAKPPSPHSSNRF